MSNLPLNFDNIPVHVGPIEGGGACTTADLGQEVQVMSDADWFSWFGLDPTPSFGFGPDWDHFLQSSSTLLDMSAAVATGGAGAPGGSGPPGGGDRPGKGEGRDLSPSVKIVGDDNNIDENPENEARGNDKCDRCRVKKLKCFMPGGKSRAPKCKACRQAPGHPKCLNFCEYSSSGIIPVDRRCWS